MTNLTPDAVRALQRCDAFTPFIPALPALCADWLEMRALLEEDERISKSLDAETSDDAYFVAADEYRALRDKRDALLARLRKGTT